MTHLLANFSSAITYDLFITLGLITSVPVSAGNFLTFKFRFHLWKKNFFVNNDLNKRSNNFQFGCFSSRHCFIWDPILRYEIGWYNINIGWIFFGNVSQQLARLYNTFIKVSPSYTLILKEYYNFLWNTSSKVLQKLSKMYSDTSYLYFDSKYFLTKV